MKNPDEEMDILCAIFHSFFLFSVIPTFFMITESHTLRTDENEWKKNKRKQNFYELFKNSFSEDSLAFIVIPSSIQRSYQKKKKSEKVNDMDGKAFSPPLASTPFSLLLLFILIKWSLHTITEFFCFPLHCFVVVSMFKICLLKIMCVFSAPLVLVCFFYFDVTKLNLSWNEWHMNEGVKMKNKQNDCIGMI